jgi:hypothetical protein
VLNRALASIGVAVVVAASQLAVAPAAYADTTTMPRCTEPDAYYLLDFQTVVGERYLLRAYAPSEHQIDICLDNYVSLRIVSPLGLTLPSVTPAVPGSCPTTLFTLGAPVTATGSVGVDPATGTVCLAVNGLKSTISVGAIGAAVPQVQVWTYGNTTINDLANCTGYYVAWAVLGGGITAMNNYLLCTQSDHRVL